MIPALFHRPPPLYTQPMEGATLPPVFFGVDDDSLTREETRDRNKFLYYEIFFDQGGFFEAIFPCLFPVTQYYMKMRNPRYYKKSMDQEMPEPIFVERTFMQSESCCCPYVDESRRAYPIKEWVDFAQKKWDEYVPPNQQPGIGDRTGLYPDNEHQPLIREQAKPGNYNYPKN